MILHKKSLEGIVTKEIQHGQVKTQTLIEGTACHTTTRDIKRLGFKDTDEYIKYLVNDRGYEIIE